MQILALGEVGVSLYQTLENSGWSWSSSNTRDKASLSLNKYKLGLQGPCKPGHRRGEDQEARNWGPGSLWEVTAESLPISLPIWEPSVSTSSSESGEIGQERPMVRAPEKTEGGRGGKIGSGRKVLAEEQAEPSQKVGVGGGTRGTVEACRPASLSYSESSKEKPWVSEE